MSAERWHVTDWWCTDGGEQDYGSFEQFGQAAEAIRNLIANGNRGGCRCHKGWKVKPCSKLQRSHGGGYIQGSECREYPVPQFDDDGDLIENFYEKKVNI